MSSKLGQNFLNNYYYLKAIADRGNLTHDDFVMEIGGGTGNLTRFLVERAGQVLTVELDKGLVETLNDRFSDKRNLTVMENDILDFDINDLKRLKKTNGRTKIIGNIPYYITTPIIFKFFSFEENAAAFFDEMIILIQKEVGERLLAQPGTKSYGMLTVGAQYHAFIEKLFIIPKNVFSPPPKIDSILMKLTPRIEPCVNVKNVEIFWKVVKAIFTFRRKTLKNSLINAGFDSSVVKDAETEFDLTIRGENLNMEKMAELANMLYNIMQKNISCRKD